MKTLDELLAADEPMSNYGRLARASQMAVLVLHALVHELKRYNDAREAKGGDHGQEEGQEQDR